MARKRIKLKGRNSPFGFFFKSCADKYKHANKKINIPTLFMKECSDKWKTLNESEKYKFYKLAKEDAMRYQREKKKYNLKGVKRPRKEKDPNLPKRPRTGFILFCIDRRNELRRLHPNYREADLTKLLGKKWAKADENVKSKYLEASQIEQNQYKHNMFHYLQNKQRDR